MSGAYASTQGAAPLANRSSALLPRRVAHRVSDPAARSAAWKMAREGAARSRKDVACSGGSYSPLPQASGSARGALRTATTTLSCQGRSQCVRSVVRYLGALRCLGRSLFFLENRRSSLLRCLRLWASFVESRVPARARLRQLDKHASQWRRRRGVQASVERARVSQKTASLGAFARTRQAGT